MGLNEKQQSGTFINILNSDGSLRKRTDETDPKAVKRDWELADGTKGTVYELVYNDISGFIRDVVFFEGKYGEILKVTLQDDEDTYILNINYTSNFAEDFMKKLPNIDISKEVTLRPFSFEDKKTKKIKRGIAINQGEESVYNYFSSYDPETKKGEFKFDFPKPDQSEGKFSNEDWKLYFAQCRKFLKKFTVENIKPALDLLPLTDSISEDVTPETAEFEDEA